MQTMALAGAGVVLLITVSVGIVAHELSHAAVLWLLGIRCDIGIGPGGVGTGESDTGVFGTLAAVTPRGTSPETAACAVRLAPVAPLLLAVSFVPVVAGVVPDPLQADSLLLGAWTVGWLACAVPSPQDFSVFWHAERAVAEHLSGSSEV
jgi:hypothetical protein